MKTRRLTYALVLGSGLLLIGGPASTQEPKQPEPPKLPNRTEGPKPPKPPSVTAIVGADVYTVTHGVIRNGVIIIQAGRILKVSQDAVVPEGATVLHAEGKIVTPGFVTVSASGVGLAGAGRGGAGGQPRPGGNQPDQSRLADSLNPFDRNILFCLASGITTASVEVSGGAGGRFGRDPADDPDGTNVCPCCGMTFLPTEPITPAIPTERNPRRSAVLKMTYGELGPMLAKESPFYHLPAGAFAGPLNRHRWRETVKRAREYLKEQAAAAAAAESGDDPGGFGGPGGMGARAVPAEVLQLVQHKIPLRTDASSVEQIRDMIALAKELDYDLVLDSVQEAWLVAGELASAKVQTVLTPRSRRRPQPGREDTTGSSIETSGALEKAGVAFAVAPLGLSVSLDGIPGRDLTSLPLEAAFAVRGGASEQTALAALTIVPARMLGLADRIGSIEEGKDADLLILSGPPLDYRTAVEKALVAGKVYYDRGRDRIYPDGPQK
jgi:imidazolonepropionase-like amidohydrolase